MRQYSMVFIVTVASSDSNMVAGVAHSLEAAKRIAQVAAPRKKLEWKVLSRRVMVALGDAPFIAIEAWVVS